MMHDSFMSTVSIFHSTNFIIADKSKFSFVGSIPEAMFRFVAAASKILEASRKLPVSGFRPLTDEMRAILAEVDKPKKGGKKKTAKEGPWTLATTLKKWNTKPRSSTPVPPPTKKRKVKKSARRTISPTPSESEHLQSNIQSDVRIEVDDPVQNEDIAATSILSFRSLFLQTQRYTFLIAI